MGCQVVGLRVDEVGVRGLHMAVNIQGGGFKGGFAVVAIISKLFPFIMYEYYSTVVIFWSVYLT